MIKLNIVNEKNDGKVSSVQTAYKIMVRARENGDPMSCLIGSFHRSER